MNRAKIYISSAIFVVLTIIKIAFPDVNAVLRHEIESLLEIEEQQTLDAIEFGEEIIDKVVNFESLTIQKNIKCLAPEKRNAYVFGAELRRRIKVTEDAGLAEKEKTDKVEAFAAEQSKITERSIPQKVLLEIVDFGFDYTSPVAGVKSSGFGYRIHPISGELKFHFGTDFAADTGTPVKAFADGTIIAAGDSDSYGKYVIIDHGSGYTSLYAHCSKLCMGCGEVKKGDTIALVGETGLATGPHLHFEIKHDGSYLDPEFYL